MSAAPDSMKTQARQGAHQELPMAGYRSHGGAQSRGVVIFNIRLGDTDLVTATARRRCCERVRVSRQEPAPPGSPTWLILQDGSYSTCGGFGDEQSRSLYLLL